VVVVVGATVVVVAAVVVVVGATVVVVGATVVVVTGGWPPFGAGSGWMPLNTKLSCVKLDGSSPTQMEQGCAVPGLGVFMLPSVTASSQVTTEAGSKPGWL
jgi:hypothetical protein